MINTALVSFGMSGKVFHAPFIATNPNFNLVGSWERSTKNIEAAYPGTKSYNSYEELLADPTIDLVVVNSPNDSHFAYTKSALLAGKHVVCEKAFTNTSAEAQELDDLANTIRKTRNLQIGNAVIVIANLQRLTGAAGQKENS